MSPDGPTTEAALAAELTALLQQAHHNGVDVRGGWECFSGPEQPDWDVVVTEVQLDEVSD